MPSMFVFVDVYVSILSRGKVHVLITCACGLLTSLSVVQFLGGRDTVKLSVGQAELMGEPGV